MTPTEQDKELREKLKIDLSWITHTHATSVEKELIEQIESLIKTELIQALKELKEETRNCYLQSIDFHDKTESIASETVKAVPVKVIDQKIKALEGEK